MFEQDCGTNERRNRGLFREEDGPFAGFGRFQVSGENDPAEVRADSMADSVVGAGLFRPPEGGGGGGFQADLPLSDLAGGGESLPAGLQGSMEQSFGADFSGVRVHTGAGADRASRDISARAFTRGQDVYFRDGAYDPGSQEGRHLIAHELAHVAAGDGGIHRDPENERSTSSAPATGERSANELRKAARAKFTYVQEDEKKAKRLIAQCSDKDVLLDQVARGEVSKEELKERSQRADEAEYSLGSMIVETEKYLEEYLEKESGGSDEIKARLKEPSEHNFYYLASLRIEELKKTEKEIKDKVKPALAWVMGDAAQTASASGGPGFPETVANMLDDAACGQFFKAVEQVHGKAAGVEDFEVHNLKGVNDSGITQGNVEETGAEKVSRVAGNLGVAAKAVKVGSMALDVTSGGMDIGAAAKGEDNTSKAEKTSSAALSGTSAVAGAASTVADAVDMGADAAILNKQESERRRKIEEMQKHNDGTGIGKAGSAKHKERTAVAGEGFGVLGDAAGVVSSSASAANNDKVSDIAGVTAASLNVVGGTLGLAADSQNAKEKKQKDTEAKKNMKALGGQLRKTISNPPEGKDTEITDICDRLDKEKFNGRGERSSLRNLIIVTSDALNTSDNKQKKQKNLLVTLRAIETGREANKEAMSEARRDAMFSTINLLGNLTTMAGSIAKMAGNSLIGSIISMVGTAIGLVGGIRDAFKSNGGTDQERQLDRNKERDDKVETCRMAVGQMAALPALDLEMLRGKRQQGLPLTETQQEVAEQYASVFSIIKTSDVDMVDFLYAVDKGNFGGQDETRSGMTLDDSLKAMYENLKFTSA